MGGNLGHCVSLRQPLALEVGTHSTSPSVFLKHCDNCGQGTVPLGLRESRLSYPPLQDPPCSSQSCSLSVAGLILSPADSHPLVPAALVCSLRMQTTGAGNACHPESQMVSGSQGQLAILECCPRHVDFIKTNPDRRPGPG